MSYQMFNKLYQLKAATKNKLKSTINASIEELFNAVMQHFAVTFPAHQLRRLQVDQKSAKQSLNREVSQTINQLIDLMVDQFALLNKVNASAKASNASINLPINNAQITIKEELIETEMEIETFQEQLLEFTTAGSSSAHPKLQMSQPVFCKTEEGDEWFTCSEEFSCKCRKCLKLKIKIEISKKMDSIAVQQRENIQKIPEVSTTNSTKMTTNLIAPKITTKPNTQLEPNAPMHSTAICASADKPIVLETKHRQAKRPRMEPESLQTNQNVSPSGINGRFESTRKFIIIGTDCAFEGCNESFANVRHMSVHMSRQHNQRLFSCPNDSCDKSFTSQFKLAQHMSEDHQQQDNWLCNSCHFTTPFPASLLTHMYVSHRIGAYQCTRCDQVFRYETLTHYNRQHC